MREFRCDLGCSGQKFFLKNHRNTLDAETSRKPARRAKIKSLDSGESKFARVSPERGAKAPFSTAASSDHGTQARSSRTWDPRISSGTHAAKCGAPWAASGERVERLVSPDGAKAPNPGRRLRESPDFSREPVIGRDTSRETRWPPSIRATMSPTSFFPKGRFFVPPLSH